MEPQTNQQVFDFLKAFCDETLVAGATADKQRRHLAYQVHDVLSQVTSTRSQLQGSINSLKNKMEAELAYMEDYGLNASLNTLGIVQSKGTDVDLLVGKYTQALATMHMVGRIVKALTE